MDPKIYGRLWDKTFEAYDPDVLRTRRQRHPIVERWLQEDARGRDPAANPLHFLYKPYFRTAVRRRRLRIFNTLMWVLKSEGFTIEPDGKNIIVGHGWHRTKFSILEGTDRPQRATSPSWRKPNGHLYCKIDAKLPAGIERDWEDEPSAPLETRIPDIMASFAVWVLERNTTARSEHNLPSCECAIIGDRGNQRRFSKWLNSSRTTLQTSAKRTSIWGRPGRQLRTSFAAWRF
jgi:hypothetical protein